MIVIDCSGTGRERGRAHGEAARDLIRQALACWRDATLGEGADDAALKDYVERFLASTALIQRIGSEVPDLMEEIRGIAEGAGVSFETIAAYNLMDEQWWYDLENPPRAEPGCSVLSAARAGGGRLLAQNMDLPSFMNGSQVVLRIRRQGAEELVLSSAGLIGLTGVSRAGFGICVNTLLMLNHDKAGLPVAAVFRGALAQPTAEDAVRFLRSVPHASGQHYAVADKEGVVGLECSAAGAAVSSAQGNASLTHTNHPLASADIAADSLAILEARGRVADSQRRLGYLDSRIAPVMSIDDTKRVLADRTTPICILPTSERPGSTFGSVLFALSESPQALFCLGTPDTGDWQELSWSV